MMSSSEIQACEDREADGPFTPMDPARWEEMERGLADWEAEKRQRAPQERWNIDTKQFEPNPACI